MCASVERSAGSDISLILHVYVIVNEPQRNKLQTAMRTHGVSTGARRFVRKKTPSPKIDQSLTHVVDFYK